VIENWSGVLEFDTLSRAETLCDMCVSVVYCRSESIITEKLLKEKEQIIAELMDEGVCTCQELNVDLKKLIFSCGSRSTGCLLDLQSYLWSP